MKTTHLWLAFTLSGLAAPLAQAQVDLTISGDIILGRRPPPPPPAVVVVVDDGPREPPPWAHGRWYQRNREYYYYPGYDVYYRPADRMWFYLDRGQWRYGRSLPRDCRVDFTRSISLTMATDRPYLFHSQIVLRYPPNYFGTRVRLRDEPRHDRDDDHRDRDDRGRDRKRDEHSSDRENGDQGRSRDRN